MSIYLVSKLAIVRSGHESKSLVYYHYTMPDRQIDKWGYSRERTCQCTHGVVVIVARRRRSIRHRSTLARPTAVVRFCWTPRRQIVIRSAVCPDKAVCVA